MHDDVHDRLLGALEGKLPPEVLDTWIRPLRVLDAHETRVELSVPNKFFRQHLEQRYLEALRGGRRERGRAARPARPLDRPLRAPAGRPGAGPRPSARSRSPLQLRDVRRRLVKPARPGGLPGGRRVPGEGLQPPVHLRRRGARQDPSAPGHRPPPHPESRASPDPVPLEREVHQRADRGDPPRQDRGVPAALPDHRPPPHRRHPVPVRQGAHPGGVLPHLRGPHAQAADRPVQRPLAEGDPGPRGAPALPLPVDRWAPTSSRRSSRPAWRS